MTTDRIHINKLLKCLKDADDFIRTWLSYQMCEHYFNFVAAAGNTVLPNIS